MMDLNKWVRPSILALKPYSSARDEFSGDASVFLDANENPFNLPFNRYPDPLQLSLKQKLAQIKSVPAGNIFIGNGSDEPIDLIIRIFCEPGVHQILLAEPTYGMYRVAADVNHVEVFSVLLREDFRLDAAELLKSVSSDTRVIFLCSPNNPSGNLLSPEAVLEVLNGFDGPVVIDEAYIDFSSRFSWLPRLAEFPNLIILQTLSKAWGMAGIRLGMAFAHPGLIGLLNKIKYPYNVNILTQKTALEQLGKPEQKETWVRMILSERERLEKKLGETTCVVKVWPTHANFFLVRVTDARRIYRYLAEKGIVVRDRSKMPLCDNCLRVTVGTPDENNALLDALNDFRVADIP
jgi:histidinol-phosphate aminotransferase